MKITFENKEKIDDYNIVYVHDSIFKSINYDSENKIIYVICQDYYHNSLKNIIFYNVIYFEFNNGYYWSSHTASEHIISWSLVENNNGIKRIRELAESHNINQEIDENNLIESCFLTSEGNEFMIICKEINYDEREI